jgi:hypothetical protein
MSLEIHLKKGIVLGMLLWMLSIAGAAVLSTIFHSEITQDIIFFALFIPITWGAAKVYYGSKGSQLSERAALGIIFILSSLVLDLLFTVPIFIRNYTAYFVNWQLWVYFIEIFCICLLTGAHRKI